ncbi:MAG: hypothetical protein JEZ03_18495 [Bacteroidales bacterium]|nr:hypothetical protein [Bacteroidales bacterium]
MKKISYLLLISVLLSGCVSSRKLLNEGNYDQAISIAVKKLKKKPDKEKEILVLKEAFVLANRTDNERIEYLRKTGEPDVWDEIFNHYGAMKRRQDEVRTLNKDILEKIHFKPIDYDNEIINSKKKAAEYFYAHAKKLLEQKGKHKARQAYEELMRVKQLYSDYKEVDALMSQAYYTGVNHVLFVIENNAQVALPERFEDEILKLSTKDVSSLWVDYDSYPDDRINYDYHIILNLQSILVSPEEAKTREYTESKEIQDGWQYVYDANGNVMKDSIGQDLSVPKYVRVSAFVTEVHLFKKSFVGGSIDYYELDNDQLIKTEPISSEWIFDHLYADVKGDVRAMSKKTKDLSRSRPIQFPSDLDMIFENTDHIKKFS